MHSLPSILGLLACAAAAQVPWTQAQLQADLREIAAVLKTDWAYYQDRTRHAGLDLDALLAEAEAALPAVRSIDEFARVLRRFTAGLQDGHAWSHVPGESAAPGRWLPFQVAGCAEGLVVTAVATGVQGPNRGDLLLRIDGTAVADLLRTGEAMLAGSTPGMRRRKAIQELQRHAGQTVRCAFATPAGAEHELTLATVAPDQVPPPPLQELPNWTLQWPRTDVALLRIASFAVPRWQEWLQAKPDAREPFLQEGRGRIEAIVAELCAKDARVLLLDLRGNGGGTDLLGIHLAERLLENPFEYFRLSARHDGRWAPPGALTYGKGKHARFLGAVVALVDERCFSTTDNFLRCLDDLHPEFTVVGRPSGGGTGAPRQLVVATHSKAVLGACTQRVYGPRGRLIEGRGTEPDLRVAWTRADWTLGRDPDLAAALALSERSK